VSRKNEAPRFVDLYDFLVKGDKNSDLHLQPGDTIFVPVLGAVAGIAGCVKRPAVYELKGAETIEDIIQLAGGILPISHLQNIVMERVEGNEKRVIKSFNLDPHDPDAQNNLKMSVRDFDIVKIYPLFKTIQQVVYLSGHVKYPREYELKAGMKLSDIIPSYDVLLPEPYLPQAEIMRLIQPDLQPAVIPFDLGGLLAGDARQNLLLQNRDRVIVYDQWSKNDMPQVTIKGEVRNPGMYRLYTGMTIKELIFQAGNLTDKAYLEKVDLVRIDKGGGSARTVKMTKSLQKVLQNAGEDNLELQRNDAVYVRSIPQYTQALERKVSLEGEFCFPGEYVFSEGERLETVIRQAGGLTGEGYAFGAVFLRESVKEVQKQQLKDYVSRLEQDILGMSSMQTQTAMDKDQAALFQQELNIKKQLLEKLKQSEPTGRMVINLQDVLGNPSSRYNFELRAGDRLIVAKKADNVNVMGEVYNPTALLV
ncbi:MAG: polysaccharide biosynthesis protein, partial [Desulfobacteraceae bacterium]